MKFLLSLLLLLSCSTHTSHTLKKASGRLRLCVVGDVGNGSSTQRKVAEAMRASGCERLIILGDVIYPNGVASADDPLLRERFYETYRHFPYIYIVLGNHDYAGNIDAWKEIAEQDKRVIHPSNYFRERFHGLCFFFLDTNFRDDPGLYEKESRWLSRALNGCRQSFAFTHHPYLSSGKRHGTATGDVKRFFEEHIIGKFRYVFSGHEHILSDEGESKGTKQIISGAGGKVDEGHLPGFVSLTVDLDHPEKSEVTINPL